MSESRRLMDRPRERGPQITFDREILGIRYTFTTTLPSHTLNSQLLIDPTTIVTQSDGHVLSARERSQLAARCRSMEVIVQRAPIDFIGPHVSGLRHQAAASVAIRLQREALSPEFAIRTVVDALGGVHGTFTMRHVGGSVEIGQIREGRAYDVRRVGGNIEIEATCEGRTYILSMSLEFAYRLFSGPEFTRFEINIPPEEDTPEARRRAGRDFFLRFPHFLRSHSLVNGSDLTPRDLEHLYFSFLHPDRAGPDPNVCYNQTVSIFYLNEAGRRVRIR